MGTSRPGRSKKGRGKARQRRACEGKRQYEAEQVARDAASARTRQSGVLYVAYRCRFCFTADGARGWHIAHKISQSRRLRG